MMTSVHTAALHTCWSQAWLWKYALLRHTDYSLAVLT